MRIKTLIIIGLMLASESAQADSQCMDSLVNYGFQFDPATIEKGALEKVREEESPHVAGEKTRWTTFKLRNAWVTTVEAVPSLISTKKYKHIAELYIPANWEGLPCGLKEGMSAKSIVALVGEPTDPEGGVGYFPPAKEGESSYVPFAGEGNVTITFKSEKDRLKGIQWYFLVD